KTNTAARNALLTMRSRTTIDSSIQAILGQRFSDLISSVNILNSEIQSIQNSESRSRFQSGLQVVQSAIVNIQQVIGTTNQPCQDLGGGCFICPPDPCKYCRGLPPSCPR